MDAADERCPDLPQVQDRTLGPGQEAWRTPAVTPHALHTGTGSRPSARAGVLPAYSTNLFASSRATTGRSGTSLVKSEVRSQTSEVRSRLEEKGSKKSEVRNPEIKNSCLGCSPRR